MSKKEISRDGLCRSCGGTGRSRGGGSCLSCGARLYYRDGDIKEVHVYGSDHSEVSQVARDLSMADKHSPLFTLIARWTFWVGALLAVLGVVLVAIGAAGNTEFTFFGQSFRSQNVGIAALFLGAALIVLNVRRVLTSVERSQKSK